MRLFFPFFKKAFTLQSMDDGFRTQTETKTEPVHVYAIVNGAAWLLSHRLSFTIKAVNISKTMKMA